MHLIQKTCYIEVQEQHIFSLNSLGLKHTHKILKEKKNPPTTVMAEWQRQKNELPRMTFVKKQQRSSQLARPGGRRHVGQVQA